MHSPAENAAQNHPQKRGRPVERAEDGADDGPEPGDVQQLDKKNLVARQFDVVHAVLFAFDGRGARRVDAEDFLHKGPVDIIAAEQQGEAHRHKRQIFFGIQLE